MKNNLIIKVGTAALLAVACAVAPLSASAAEAKDAKAKAKPYPLDTCAVTGEKLGGMGDAYVFVHNGQEVKLCCKGCLKTFNKEPETYMKKIADAQKKK